MGGRERPAWERVDGAQAWDSYGVMHRLTDVFTVACGAAGCVVEVKTALVGGEWHCPECYP